MIQSSQIHAKVNQAQIGEKLELGDSEWRVLKREDDRLLLLSEHVVDIRPFHDKKPGEITWEKCSLREWLNGWFYDNLPSELQNIVLSTELNNLAYLGAEVDNAFFQSYAKSTIDFPDHQKQDKSSVVDKVFLLSAADASNLEFFADNEARVAKNSDGDPVVWWLRSPGVPCTRAAVVWSNGEADFEGLSLGIAAYSNDIGVRPAIWVNALVER